MDRQVLTEQVFVTEFDWEYNLLLALSLALVVIGVIGVLYLAT